MQICQPLMHFKGAKSVLHCNQRGEVGGRVGRRGGVWNKKYFWKWVAAIDHALKSQAGADE